MEEIISAIVQQSYLILRSWWQQLSNFQRYSFIGISDWPVCYKAICVCLQKKAGNLTHKGIWEVIKMSFVFVVSRANKGWALLWHPAWAVCWYRAAWWDAFNNTDIIPIWLRMLHASNLVSLLDHRYFVLLRLSIAKSKFITLFYNLEQWDEKIGFIAIILWVSKLC